MNLRLKYFFIICFIIVTGLISRKVDWIPLFIGDVLYAMMIFFLVRFLLIKMNLKNVVIVSLAICYLIEFLQLFQTPWMVSIRETTFGRLVLGQGFLWSDLLAYTFGVLLAYIFENLFHKRTTHRFFN